VRGEGGWGSGRELMYTLIGEIGVRVRDEKGRVGRERERGWRGRGRSGG